MPTSIDLVHSSGICSQLTHSLWTGSAAYPGFDYGEGMLPRRLIAPALAVLAALGLVACAPDPVVSTPTPTVLSEDQAYAQAEATFRAYVDALNQIDVADPATFEPAFALTTGTQNSFDRKQYSQWHADGWSQIGKFRSALLDPVAISDRRDNVQLASCLDVSNVAIVDSSGKSVVDVDRGNVQTLTISVVQVSDGIWKIDALSPRSGAPSCS